LIKVVIHTGNHEFDEVLTDRLSLSTKPFDAEIVDFSDEADIVVCLPDLIHLFSAKILLVLTDDVNYLLENDHVLDIAPVPVTENDFLRLEWKFVRVLDFFSDDL